jgi:hypothetical protein
MLRTAPHPRGAHVVSISSILALACGHQHTADLLVTDGKDCAATPGCEGGVPPRTMYLETVEWATSNPSISSSPWIRDEPAVETRMERVFQPTHRALREELRESAKTRKCYVQPPEVHGWEMSV